MIAFQILIAHVVARVERSGVNGEIGLRSRGIGWVVLNSTFKAVERTVSYLDKVSFESLPILPTGTCIFAGLLANVPVVVDIGKIDEKYEPRNKTMTLVDQWK